jgi:signal transduction histidine kinase
MGYLERVLFNLMSNALKFTEDDGSICCSLTRDADRVVLEVTDTGIGIPAEEQEHLFTRFFRSSTAKQQAIQGTGLGLAIASSIVTRHGGEMDVVSEHGRGTRVRVVLPAVAIHDVVVRAAPRREGLALEA